MVLKLVLSMFIAGAVLSPKMVMPFLGPEYALRIDDIAVVFAIAWLAVQWFSGRRPAKTLLDIPILLFFSAVCAAGVAGIVQMTAGSPLLSVAYALKLAEYLVAFWFAVMVGQELGRDRTIFLVIICACLAGVLGIAEWFWAVGAGLVDSADQWYRIFNNSVYPNDANHFAGLFAIASALAVAFALDGRRGLAFRLGLAGAALGLLFVIVLTGSRGGLFAWVVACLVTALFAQVKGRLTFVSVSCVLVLGVIAASAIASARGGIFTEYKDYQDSKAQLAAGYSEEYSSGRNRFMVWDAVVEETMEHPAFGTGLGSRGRQVYENQFIWAFAETGFVGLTAFLWLMVQLWRGGMRMAREGSAGVLGAVCAMTVMSCVSNAFLITRMAVVFWIVVGVACGAMYREGPSSKLQASN